MRKILLGILIGLGFIASTAYAVTVFNSNQVGNSPGAGKVLQTNGTTSTWVATSTLGIVGGGGGSASASAPSLGVQYNDGTGTLTATSTMLFFGGNTLSINGSLKATSSLITNATTTNLFVSGVANVPTISDSNNSTAAANTAYIHSSQADCPIAWFNPTGDGSTDDSAAFTAANAQCGRIILNRNKSYAIGTNTSLSAMLVMNSSSTLAQLVIKTGVTLTLNNQIVSPLQKIFSYQGTGKVQFGTQYMVVYPEWWGALGDDSTDDSIPIQSALNAVNGGNVQLGTKTYRITRDLTIPTSYTQLLGQSQRGTVINNSSTTGDTIIVASDSNVDCTGNGSTVGNAGWWNGIKNMTIKRNTAATAGSGITSTKGCGLTLYNLDIVDNVNSVYLSGVAHSYMERVYVDYTGSSGSARYGLNIDTTVNTQVNSTRVKTFVVSGSGSNITGLFIHGSCIADQFVDDFETANVDYGVVVTSTGADNGFCDGDVHLRNNIHDSNKIAAFQINNVFNKNAPNVSIEGGYVATEAGTTNSICVDVENSQGVAVIGLQCRMMVSGAVGVKVNGGASANNRVIGNKFDGTPTGVLLTGNASSTVVSGNNFTSTAAFQSTTHISVATSTYNTITDNTLAGYATTGISVNAGSSNNNVSGNVINPANITTSYSSLGNNNVYFDPAKINFANATSTGQLFLTGSMVTAGSFLAVNSAGMVVSTSTPSGSAGNPCTSSAFSLQYNSGGSFGCVTSLISNGTVVGYGATSSTVAFNLQGSGSLDPLQAGTSTNTSMLLVKGNTGFVGINTSTPIAQLNVIGNLLVSRTTGTAGGAGFSGYSFQRTITIDHTKASTTLANFTILASTTLSSLKTTGNGGNVQSATGFDIVFSTSSDCSTLMRWETEKYASTTGEIDAWILIPSLSPSVDTTLYMCYGNSGISSFQGGTIGQAWDTNYKGVYHLPNGTTVSGANSIANSSNLTASGTPVTAKVDGGTTISNGQFLTATTSPITGTYPYTMDVWAKIATTTFAAEDEHRLYSASNGVDEFAWISYYEETGFSPALRTAVCTAGCGSIFYNEYDLPGGINTNWHHIVGIFTAAGTQSMFYDGVPIVAVRPSGAGATPSFSQSQLGTLLSCAASTCFPGTLDEARISQSSRTIGWIITEYNNINSISTFETFGNESSGASTLQVLPVLYSDTSAHVGINTSTPASSLTVVGSGSDNVLEVASSSGTSYLRITNLGNVGIGTTTPGQTLTVVGTSQFTSNVILSNLLGQNCLGTNASGQVQSNSCTSTTTTQSMFQGGSFNIWTSGFLNASSSIFTNATITQLSLNGINYNWPSVNATGTLYSNGLGTLSWATTSQSMVTNSGSRILNAVYQNKTGHTMMIDVDVSLGYDNGTCTFRGTTDLMVGPASTSIVSVAEAVVNSYCAINGGGQTTIPMFMIVPPTFFYKASTTPAASNPGLVNWTENLIN